MNVCTRGNCICDAAEWAGDTDCFGDVVGVEPTAVQTWTRRLYYLDYEISGTGRPVVISIDDPTTVQLGSIEFYEDPDLTRRAT